MIAIDLSKQQVLDADPKAIQQFNFKGNLAPDRDENTRMLFIIQEAKETFRFFTRNCVSIKNLFCFNQYKMTQYNTLNVKLSNSQLNETKSGIENGTRITLNLSSNVTGDSNDETNCPHK